MRKWQRYAKPGRCRGQKIRHKSIASLRQRPYQKTGLYDEVIASLNEADVDFIELGNVQPNPRLSLVREGIKLCRENKVDFIYSNSFDHSYDPTMCLDKWMKCIKKGKGVCFIHWMSTNANKIDAADCFAATLKEFGDLFNKKYQVVEQFGRRGRIIFMIKHKDK